MGLDADPDDVDDLTGGDVADDDGDWPAASGPRLYTSLLVHECADGTTHAFDATIASNVEEARSRLAARRGRRLADVADIREGFDVRLPLVEALVSPAVADMLLQIADAPGSPLARGLEVSIEQRFAA